MRRGVSSPAIAPPAVAVQPPEQVVRHPSYFPYHLLLAMLITFALVLPPPITAARSAYTRAQTYAAWTCSGVYHVVRRGETIYSIARRYGTTAYRIAVCNGLASYTVYVGQTLLVPLTR